VICDALCPQVQTGLHVERSRLYRTVHAHTFADLEHDVCCDAVCHQVQTGLHGREAGFIEQCKHTHLQIWNTTFAVMLCVIRCKQGCM